MEDAPFRENRLIVRDDLEIYYREYGDYWSDKLPVLCLPGLTRNCRDFHRVASWLSQDRYVICPDYRGRGQSSYDHDWRRYNAVAYISDIIQLIMATNIDELIILGTSMGGLLSLGINIAKPRLMKGLIMNDIGPTITSSGKGRIVNYIGLDKPKPSLEAAIEHLRTFFPHITMLSEQDWHEFAVNTFRKKEDGLYHYDWDQNIVKAIKAESSEIPDLWAMFRATKKFPVLCLHGAVSDLLSEETVLQMAEEHPDFRYITLPNVGHAPTLNELASRKAIADYLQHVEKEESFLSKWFSSNEKEPAT